MASPKSSSRRLLNLSKSTDVQYHLIETQDEHEQDLRKKDVSRGLGRHKLPQCRNIEDVGASVKRRAKRVVMQEKNI